MKVAELLGFKEHTKLLIIHADDAGLSHSENMATIESLNDGVVNSYSIMVNCPWSFEICQFAKHNPQFDYGIHLTLTCEWENYRFGSVSPNNQVSSLLDQNGFFYKKREQLVNNATLEDVEKELDAQIQRAFQLGLNPSHIDSHMYSVGACPEFFKIYRELGTKYQLPIMVSEQLMEMVGLNPKNSIKTGDLLVKKAHYGIYHYFESHSLSEYYSKVFEDLVSGLNIILIHPAYDNFEMQGITVNHPNFGSEWRQIDFDSFTGDRCKEQLKKSNIELITWRDIKNVMYK